MHDQNKETSPHIPRVVSGSTLKSQLLRRVIPVMAGATFALATVSGAARAADYGGDGDGEASKICETVGCADGNRYCATWTGIANVSVFIPVFPFSITQPYLLSGICYEAPRQ